MTDAVRRILDNYASENPGTKGNLARILNHGRLAGTGKLVILPVDQGFEHGPARSFAENPPGYDPYYHAELAIDAGCNAYAAPYGSIAVIADRYAGELPLILKINNHDSLTEEKNPIPALTASVKTARRLGCVAVGFTIYPGSSEWRAMFEQLRAVTEEAKDSGLAVVVWSYPRGTTLSKEGETGIDVVTYAAQIACQMGANIVKVKLPSDHVELGSAKKVYDKEKISVGTATDRVRHVIQSAFDGRRIVIFSGGSKQGDESFFNDIRAIRDGGGFGSIIGRNSFQRPRDEAIKFLHSVMDIYSGDSDQAVT